MAASIPLVDLGRQHQEIAEEVREGFEQVLGRTAFILGAEVEEFETAFAAYSGTCFCVGMGSGTDAIELMVRSLDLGPEDEVLLPANTFIATALGVLRAGARVALADCDRDFLLDPERVEERIGPRTRALLPVHLYGQVAAMEGLSRIAEERGLLLLEDAAQAHGARAERRRAGSFGDAAAVSFYPGKNLGAYGDGGAVLTSSEALAGRLRRLRNWGSERKYHHPEIGFNSRLDTLQAVVLSAKLRRLDRWNEARCRAAARYDELLGDVPGVERPRTLVGNEHTYHLYVIRVPDRDRVLEGLLERGVGAGIHYPTPVHLHGALRNLGYREGEFPEAERASREVLSLPMGPHLTAAEQEQVVAALQEVLPG